MKEGGLEQTVKEGRKVDESAKSTDSRNIRRYVSEVGIGRSDGGRGEDARRDGAFQQGTQGLRKTIK